MFMPISRGKLAVPTSSPFATRPAVPSATNAQNKKGLNAYLSTLGSKRPRLMDAVSPMATLIHPPPGTYMLAASVAEPSLWIRERRDINDLRNEGVPVAPAVRRLE